MDITEAAQLRATLLDKEITQLRAALVDKEAIIARLQEALSDQEAKTALTRVAAEYHVGVAERYAKALERIVEVGGAYEARIAEDALVPF